MKINKIALSILAIAISSSAFASSVAEQNQKYKQVVLAELNSSTYDIVNAVAYVNVIAGAKGHDSSDFEFTSAQKEFITKEIVLPIRTAICAEAFKALNDENSGIEELNNYPAEVSSLDRKNLTALRATGVLTSCSIINPDTHKIEVLGLNDGEEKTSRALQPTLNFNITKDAVKAADEYSYKGVPISKEQFESGVAALLARQESGGNGDTDLVLRNLITPDQTEILESQEGTAIYSGAIHVASEFKAKENAKEISEFNALQEIALKESDSAVKALIKQAADLKLASYRQ